jgi:hypothetical protein
VVKFTAKGEGVNTGHEGLHFLLLRKKSKNILECFSANLKQQGLGPYGNLVQE